MTKNERIGLVFAKTGSINSGTEHRAGGGGSRSANSDRGLVLGVGGSRKTGSRARPRRDFFPDSNSDRDSDRDSDETFQISQKLGHVHVEFFCLLDSQPCL
jgi:hypothetical protein